MPEVNDWWSSWAPLWEYMENQHMSTYVADSFIEDIEGPALVIGAGQGLIVKYLRDKGFRADGVDLEPTMVTEAKKRHGIELILGDARELPIKSKSYKTVIISSGVVDYATDPDLIKDIINEALRVTAVRGKLFVAFYQVKKRIEKIYNRIGVISQNYLYHKRIFEIDRIARKNPIQCAFPIQEWTGMSLFKTIAHWTWIGLTLPKEFMRERDKMDMIFAEAKKIGIDPQDLIDSIPDSVPYRTAEEINTMLREMGFIYNDATRFNDCYLVTFHKSSVAGIAGGMTKKKSASQPVVKTEGLCKRYKKAAKNAVDSLNITIEEGSIYGLLGPNGAGKTTALSMIVGLLKPDKGMITYSGKLLKKHERKNLKRILGYVPQELALYEMMTARENLMFYARLHGVDQKEIRQRTTYLLQQAGLEKNANQIVKSFSTGMKRRLNLVAGLVNKPRFILLDEPTVGIDPQSRNRIFELILKVKEEGATILYTTHYMEEAMKLCDTVAIMDYGSIVISGNPNELIDNYGLTRINFTADKEIPGSFKEKLLEEDMIFDLNITDRVMTILTIKITDNMTLINHINDKAAQAGIALSLKNIEEPDLESLFLDITGRNLRDSQG